MKLEIGKRYKVVGHTLSARVVDVSFKTDIGGTCAVAIVGGPNTTEYVHFVQLDGKVNGTQFLVEATPWDDFKIGDKVLVWSEHGDGSKYRRYFAGISQDGKPMAFREGCTAWSAEGHPNALLSWDFCEKVEDEKD